ncbi:AAA family ATPase [Nocardia huaxiensis]|uniref:AAA family ATPase n=1 Tax=Nocardia huaxiensis TaxID=2755382 RepID=A0A7D6ZNR6_9NOCA|nr:AAA family ATPase [Nocardia huaxiensis]
MYLVEGPAGIGKSRLLREFASRAQARGLRTVVVAATEFEQSSPHFLLMDIADRLDAENSEAVSAGSGIRESARWLRQRLEAVPTVLIIDDAHWADTASLRVLAVLLRQLPESVRVAVAYREGQFPDALGSPLRATGVTVAHIAVPPLSPTEASALLPGIPPGRREVLVDAAHGNPLYLQLLADLTPAEFDAVVRADDPAASRAEHATADRTDHAVPDQESHAQPDRVGHAALDRTIRAELAQLPERERLVAQAAAVCGATSDMELLCATAEVTREELSGAVDELARRGWITVTRGTLAFRHPLIRTAAYRLAGEGWRADAHTRAAQVLRAADAPLLTRARHLEHALGGCDELAAAELVRAAELALGTAPAVSARWIEAALRTAPQYRGPAGFSARLRLGQALLLSGSAERARDSLEPLLPAAPLVDAPANTEGTEAVLWFARCERILGRVDSARKLLEQAVSRLGGTASGPIRLELAMLELQDNRDAEAAGRIRSLFESGAVRDPAIGAAALTLRSMGHLNGLDLKAAAADYRVAEREFARLTDAQLVDGLPAVAALGWMAYFLDDQRTGLIHIERALRVGRSRGRSFILPELYAVHAYSLAKLGRYEEALAAAEDAAETAGLYGYPGVAPLAGAAKLRVLEDTASREEVLAWWHTLDALPRPAMRWWRGVVDAALLEIAARLGLDPPRPEPNPLSANGTPAGSAPRVHPMRAAELSMAALAATARGDLDPAAALLAQAATVAEQLGLPGQRAAVARARAEYLCASGDLDGAQHAADAAMDDYAQAGMPVFRARTLLVAARIAGQRGDFTAATAHISAARSAFATAGAHTLIDTATTAQRRLAGHRTVTGATTLTAREREVAHLAAQGLTNKDIAAQLYLSPRTVEDHLARILRKLGLTSRAGIAHRLAAMDAPEP